MSDNSKRPLGFVNRRGHDTDISPAELAELSIDTQPEKKAVPVAEKGSQKSKPSKKIPTSKPKTRRRAKWTRKKTLILAIVLAVLVVIPVVLGEVLRIQYSASASSAQESLKTIVTKDVLPMQKKTDITSKQVSTITNKLEAVRDDMCPGGMLDNLASLYPRSESAHTACIDERGHIASLVTQLRDMEKMLSYIESMNTALVLVNTPTTDAYAVIATQQSNWQAANEALAKLSPPTQLKTANDQLVAAVKSISDGWSKLNVANNAQNAADFQAAEKQLSTGYDAVRASKAVFSSAITDKQVTITKFSTDLY